MSFCIPSPAERKRLAGQGKYCDIANLLGLILSFLKKRYTPTIHPPKPLKIAILRGLQGPNYFKII